MILTLVFIDVLATPIPTLFCNTPKGVLKGLITADDGDKNSY